MASRESAWTAVAIATGLVLAGALLWTARSGQSAVDCNPGGFGGTPLPAFFALSIPKEAVVGLDHWYNFTVQTGYPSLHLGNLGFQVQNAGGATINPSTNWTLGVWNVTGGQVAGYSFSQTSMGDWTFGATFPIYSQETISLLAVPENLSGDLLIVTLSGSYTNGCPVMGAVSVNIP